MKTGNSRARKAPIVAIPFSWIVISYILALCGAVGAAGAVGAVAAAEAPTAADRSTSTSPSSTGIRRSAGIRGWTVHVDNDLFAFTDDDQDYTAGISVTFGGDDGKGNFLSRPLGWLDARSGFASLFGEGGRQTHSLEAGLALFTPQDLSATEPLHDDRPYANLAYVSSSQLTVHPTKPVAHQSSMTIGLLGTPLAEQLHRGVHAAIGSQKPMGYAHQISDGGEPTFRYGLSRYRLLRTGTYDGRTYTLRLGTGGSIGYLTEANAALDLRWGNLDAPWWSSPPAASDYAGHPAMKSVQSHAARASGLRWQLAAGINVRARLYNSFLQGQFRSSDVRHSSSRLNHRLVEAWIGVTTVLRNDVAVSYTLRHQTEELRSGDGARSFTWAGIGLSRQL